MTQLAACIALTLAGIALLLTVAAAVPGHTATRHAHPSVEPLPAQHRKGP